MSDDVEPLSEAPPEPLRRAQEDRLRRTWAAPTGWRYWSAVNNTEVGVWYTAMSFLFFLFAGVLALLMRVQLARPENDFLSAEFYNQAFTVHGSVMMFLFAIPIFEAVAGRGTSPHASEETRCPWAGRRSPLPRGAAPEAPLGSSLPREGTRQRSRGDLLAATDAAAPHADIESLRGWLREGATDPAPPNGTRTIEFWI